MILRWTCISFAVSFSRLLQRHDGSVRWYRRFHSLVSLDFAIKCIHTCTFDLFLSSCMSDIRSTNRSSMREPSQVFSLLESVYHQFDRLAKVSFANTPSINQPCLWVSSLANWTECTQKRGVFKVGRQRCSPVTWLWFESLILPELLILRWKLSGIAT